MLAGIIVDAIIGSALLISWCCYPINATAVPEGPSPGVVLLAHAAGLPLVRRCIRRPFGVTIVTRHGLTFCCRLRRIPASAGNDGRPTWLVIPPPYCRLAPGDNIRVAFLPARCRLFLPARTDTIERMRDHHSTMQP